MTVHQHKLCHLTLFAKVLYSNSDTRCITSCKDDCKETLPLHNQKKEDDPLDFWTLYETEYDHDYDYDPQYA